MISAGRRARRRCVASSNQLIFLTTCGPATTFDPKITGVSGVWYFDDGSQLAAASGEEISKTFADDGLHRAVFRPASGVLTGITIITVNQDLLVGELCLDKCASLASLVSYINASARINIDVLFQRCPLTSIIAGYCGAYGNLSSVSSRSITYLDLNYSTYLYGSVSDLPSTLTIYVKLYNCPNITSGSISHLISIREIQFQSMSWLTADVDTVISSMWTARANYTYATPSLNIGGTNEAPTGTVGAPVEGADWHQDGATWIPLTSGAMIYDLAKNVNSEVRTAAWSITYTGGSITP